MMDEDAPKGFGVLTKMRDAMIGVALEKAKESLLGELGNVERAPGAAERIAITILMSAANEIANQHKLEQASFFGRHLRMLANAVAGWNRHAN